MKLFNLFNPNELAEAEKVANDLLSTIKTERDRQARVNEAAQNVRSVFATLQSALNVLKSQK